MPERLKKLKRLSAAWSQRKKSTDRRIAAAADQIALLHAEERNLMDRRDGDMGLFGLFADVSTRRLLLLRDQKLDIARKMDALRAVLLNDSLNLRRCEISGEKQALELRRKGEAAALEAVIEAFLGGKP
jgi:hypothetical protein